MRPEEYAALDAVESEHWFYAGKRRIARAWIERVRPLGPEDLLVDVGAGTGRLVSELAGNCRVIGIEPSFVALAIARRRTRGLVCGDSLALPIANGAASVVTALDVIEHLDDDRAALAELARITRPGGLVVLNVPAWQILWSDWDVALGHRRRYRRQTLLALVDRRVLRVVRCAYTNPWLFLPMLVYRRLRTALGTGAGARLEDRALPGPVNSLLRALYVASANAWWLRPPFGSSVFAVLERIEPPERAG
ncbi:MAG TPA: class I SAM-dependent methyltransferase [Thermoanaerobaculia bacterium]|nr:class I SAM-dependent methyltransferase [Thermoanaerobaculia bacterium]